MNHLLSVMPVGAPWGGPESVRFPSCFASLAMVLEKYDANSPVYCTEGPGFCRQCGKCAGTVMQKKHEELHHLYLTVSGLGLHTIWREDWLAQYMEDMEPVLTGDAHIERAMAYAGYAFKSVDGIPKDAAMQEIQRSVDAGRPVLAYNVFGSDCSIVTGYDDGALYGRFAPKPWDPPALLPVATDGDGVSRKADWYNPAVRLLIITGRNEPLRNMPEVFQALSRILRQPATKGCVSGPAAYDACLKLLADDAFFQAIDGDTLRKCYFYIHALVGALAEGRCFASFAFLSGFYGQVKDAALDLAHTIGAYFMDTHNKCWGAWAAMGNNHICESDKYAEAFRAREVRVRVASFFLEFRQNDEMAMRLLADSTRINWFNMEK